MGWGLGLGCRDYGKVSNMNLRSFGGGFFQSNLNLLPGHLLLWSLS